MTHVPFSWARRNPGCSPLCCSSTSATSAPERRAGDSQPAVQAKARPIVPTVNAIRARRAIVRNGRGGCGGGEIGRASWRERVWQDGEISVVAGALKKKQKE